MEIEFNEKNFQTEALDYKDGPVLVDFFATWCGPCQMLSPIIEDLGKELAGTTMKVGKCDVDKNPVLSEKFSVMSVPTLIIFRNGEVKEEMHGLQSAEFLKEKLALYK